MRVIFASYGNDSLALIEWARRHLTPGAVTVAYSDTGWSADFWAHRVERAEAWVRSLGFDCVRIGSEGMRALVRRKSAWPRGGGGKFQFCTRALKIEPALAWLDSADPLREAICMVGIRREESAARATFPEWVEASENHGGRSLHAPLVAYTAAMRDELLRATRLRCCLIAQRNVIRALTPVLRNCACCRVHASTKSRNLKWKWASTAKEINGSCLRRRGTGGRLGFGRLLKKRSGKQTIYFR